eukprot:gene4343-311_t
MGTAVHINDIHINDLHFSTKEFNESGEWRQGDSSKAYYSGRGGNGYRGQRGSVVNTWRQRGSSYRGGGGDQRDRYGGGEGRYEPQGGWRASTEQQQHHYYEEEDEEYEPLPPPFGFQPEDVPRCYNIKFVNATTSVEVEEDGDDDLPQQGSSTGGAIGAPERMDSNLSSCTHTSVGSSWQAWEILSYAQKAGLPRMPIQLPSPFRVISAHTLAIAVSTMTSGVPLALLECLVEVTVKPNKSERSVPYAPIKIERVWWDDFSIPCIERANTEGLVECRKLEQYELTNRQRAMVMDLRKSEMDLPEEYFVMAATSKKTVGEAKRMVEGVRKVIRAFPMLPPPSAHIPADIATDALIHVP